MTTAEAILETLQSGTLTDRNLEPANIADVLSDIARANRSIANAIKPFDASQGRDATGGIVTSLTEAVMGMTAAMCRIADSISDVASAIRDHGENSID